MKKINTENMSDIELVEILSNGKTLFFVENVKDIANRPVVMDTWKSLLNERLWVADDTDILVSYDGHIINHSRLLYTSGRVDNSSTAMAHMMMLLKPEIDINVYENSNLKTIEMLDKMLLNVENNSTKEEVYEETVHDVDIYKLFKSPSFTREEYYSTLKPCDVVVLKGTKNEHSIFYLVPNADVLDIISKCEEHELYRYGRLSCFDEEINKDILEELNRENSIVELKPTRYASTEKLLKSITYTGKDKKEINRTEEHKLYEYLENLNYTNAIQLENFRSINHVTLFMGPSYGYNVYGTFSIDEIKDKITEVLELFVSKFNDRPEFFIYKENAKHIQDKPYLIKQMFLLKEVLKKIETFKNILTIYN